MSVHVFRVVKAILTLSFLFLLVSPQPVLPAPESDALRVICHVAMPWVVGNQVVEPLLYVDNDNRFIPCLAESYRMHDDYLDLQLRKDVQFQDGSPFDAASVLMNWEAYLKTANPYFTIDLRMGIDRMEAVSPHSVRMWFKKDGLIGLIPVYLRSFYIYSPSYFERFEGLYPPGNQANLSAPGLWGTGPYVIKENLDDGDTIVLEKNPHYWEQGRPKVSTVIVSGARKYDSVTAHRLMKEGKADLFDAVAPSMLPVLSRSKHVAVVIKRPLSFLASLLNLRRPGSPLLDMKVRKALNLLIDRRTLLKYLARGSARVTPFIFPLAEERNDLQPYPYRPEEAKALLAEAGYNETHRLSITIGYFEDQKKLANAIAGMLGEGGIETNFQEYKTRLEWYEHFMEYTHGPSNPMENEKWDLNIVFTPLYSNSLATYFGECFVSKGGYRWISRDAHADELFFTAMQQRDPRTAEESLLKMEKYLYDQYYMIPIYINPTILAVHRRIAGNSFSSSGYLLNLKEIGIHESRK